MTEALVIADFPAMADCLCRMLGYFQIVASPAYGPDAANLSQKEKILDIIILATNVCGVSGSEEFDPLTL